MTQQRPNRALGGEHDEFWAHCASHQLHLQQCGRCDAYTWPPDKQCESCGSGELSWQKVSGRGRLVSWGTFEHRYYPELPVPWETILVELAEGPLFISNPAGFDHAGMRPDMELEVRFIECRDSHGQFSLPVFAIPGPATTQESDES
jgi:uncharacterized protein